MRRVAKVKPLEGFRIWVRFDDGVEGEIDLCDLAGKGVFSAWSDRELFESVELGPDRGITWPGNLDLCADSLYLRLTGRSLKDSSMKPSTPTHA